KVKAAFVALVEEHDIYKLRTTMIELERTFNEREGYPWVIISDKVFSKKFREWITNASKAPVYFGQAPAIEWQEPYWVDIKKAEKNMKQMVKDHNIDKGESMSWRRMTRYNMGFIAHHPLLKDLEYYWKVQPGSRYACDIQTDPFKKMKAKGQKLSFALTMVENHENLDEFFDVVNGFIGSRNKPIDPNNPLGEHSGHFTNCMIYNNFAIFSLQFLRSKEYTKYFDELDASGGFFYHRWGDALPQTIAASLLLKRSEIAYNDIPGYASGAGSVCPQDINEYAELKCTC
ncbi:glycosyltransferase family 15 protein, partial [Mucor lusitanicus CBS 277.49]